MLPPARGTAGTTAAGNGAVVAHRRRTGSGWPLVIGRRRIPLASCDRPAGHHHMIVGIGRRGRALLFVSLFLVGFVVVLRCPRRRHRRHRRRRHTRHRRGKVTVQRARQLLRSVENRFVLGPAERPPVAKPAGDGRHARAADAPTRRGRRHEAADVRRRDQPVRWHRRPSVRPARDRRDRRSACRLSQRHDADPPLDGRLTGRHSGAACIIHDQRTILVTKSDASNADLGASSGRLVATGSGGGNRAGAARRPGGERDGSTGARSRSLAGSDPGDVEFVQTARAVLAANKIRWSNRAAPVSCSSRRSTWRRSPC